MFMWFSNGMATLAKMGGQIKVGQSRWASHDVSKGAASYAHSAIRVRASSWHWPFPPVSVLFAHPLIGFFKPELDPQVAADAPMLISSSPAEPVIFSFLNQVYTGNLYRHGQQPNLLCRHRDPAAAAHLMPGPDCSIFGLGPIPAMGVMRSRHRDRTARRPSSRCVFLQAGQGQTNCLFPRIHRSVSRPERSAVREIILRLGLPSCTAEHAVLLPSPWCSPA